MNFIDIKSNKMYCETCIVENLDIIDKSTLN